MVEGGEEFVSDRGDVACVEASAWEARQRAISVEETEKVISSIGGTIAEISC